MLVRFAKKIKTADGTFCGDMHVADELAVAFVKQGRAVSLDPAYSFSDNGDLILAPEHAEVRQYTEKEICSMKLYELRALAKERGITASANIGKALLITKLLGED